MKNVGH